MTNATPNTETRPSPEVIVVDNVALLNREALVGMVQTCGEVLGLTETESGAIREVQIIDLPTPDASLPPVGVSWAFGTNTTRHGVVQFYIQHATNRPLVDVVLYQSERVVRSTEVITPERLERLSQQPHLMALAMAQEIARDVKAWVDAYVDPRRVVKNDTQRHGTWAHGTMPMVTNAPDGVAWNYGMGVVFRDTRFTHEPRYARPSSANPTRWSCWRREANGNERHIQHVTRDEAVAWVAAAPRC